MSKGLQTGLIVIGIILVLGILIYNLTGGTYNKLVRLEEAVKAQWGQVENVYQRRADLIPNLVETVKGYAAHEKDTLKAVVDARSRVGSFTVDQSVINNPESFQKFQAAQGQLSSALSRLMMVTENYPNLKANENFLELQSQLEGTENRIAVERKRYNDAAQEFNTVRRSFPAFIIANMAGMQEKAYFQAEEGAKTAPKVKF
ncbi:MAG: LemA family protein [Brevinematales bacterium]|jgi:LemA protein